MRVSDQLSRQEPRGREPLPRLKTLSGVAGLSNSPGRFRDYYDGFPANCGVLPTWKRSNYRRTAAYPERGDAWRPGSVRRFGAKPKCWKTPVSHASSRIECVGHTLIDSGSLKRRCVGRGGQHECFQGVKRLQDVAGSSMLPAIRFVMQDGQL